MTSEQKHHVFMLGFIGMAIIGGIGVSLGFSPVVGGTVGFAMGVLIGINNPDPPKDED